MSTEADYKTILDTVDIQSNGVTLCSGSLGARADNDLPGIMQRLGDRVHFLHLRKAKRETDAIVGSFKVKQIFAKQRNKNICMQRSKEHNACAALCS